MASVGSGSVGKTLIGTGNGASPTYASIGTNSGLTAHGVLVAEGSGAFAATAAGSAGQILQSGGASADPVYSTANYPATAGTSGNVITSDGTNFVSQALSFVGSPTYFQAYLTSPVTFNGGSTTDTIVFDSAIVNVGSAYSTATGIFTAPVSGFYGFATTVYYNNLNNLVGNTETILGYTGSGQSLRISSEGTGAQVLGMNIIVTSNFAIAMTAGEMVKIQPFCTGTGTYDIFGSPLSSSAFNTSSTFSGYRIA